MSKLTQIPHYSKIKMSGGGMHSFLDEQGILDSAFFLKNKENFKSWLMKEIPSLFIENNLNKEFVGTVFQIAKNSFHTALIPSDFAPNRPNLKFVFNKTIESILEKNNENWTIEKLYDLFRYTKIKDTKDLFSIPTIKSAGNQKLKQHSVCKFLKRSLCIEAILGEIIPNLTTDIDTYFEDNSLFGVFPTPNPNGSQKNISENIAHQYSIEELDEPIKFYKDLVWRNKIPGGHLYINNQIIDGIQSVGGRIKNPKALIFKLLLDRRNGLKEVSDLLGQDIIIDSGIGGEKEKTEKTIQLIKNISSHFLQDNTDFDVSVEVREKNILEEDQKKDLEQYASENFSDSKMNCSFTKKKNVDSNFKNASLKITFKNKKTGIQNVSEIQILTAKQQIRNLTPIKSSGEFIKYLKKFVDKNIRAEGSMNKNDWLYLCKMYLKNKYDIKKQKYESILETYSKTHDFYKNVYRELDAIQKNPFSLFPDKLESNSKQFFDFKEGIKEQSSEIIREKNWETLALNMFEFLKESGTLEKADSKNRYSTSERNTVVGKALSYYGEAISKVTTT